ncbi:MAG TPA: flagellar hook capping FlgD N-terminal domain-containing protein [Syntrophomonadaceae bacterium]|nr:flagellar hook capping FlgD N-terminal domain-containing protein [Syntrophomonadaceae bacterium]
MAVIGDVSSASTVNSTSGSNKATQELGKYEFLKILAAELQNQDPTNPLDNKDFISQMAQFSSLEQMQNLTESLQNYLEAQTGINDSLVIAQSATLIGKNAIAEIDGNNVEGTISSIFIKDSAPYAVIGENTVPVSSITKLSEDNQVSG